MTYYSQTFAKLPLAKREHIMHTATLEFAHCGYDSASINTIAKKADISIGAMYSYFGSKENLFLALIADGKQLLKKAIHEINFEVGNIFEVLTSLILVTIDYSETYTDFVSLYHSLSTTSLNRMTKQLTDQAERDFREFYRQLLKNAIAQGEVRADIDIDLTALFIDNIVVMTELSVANPYHRHRLEQYVGEAKALDREYIANTLTELIKRSIAP